MAYYLVCSVCGERKMASPQRYQKWQIRLRNLNQAYACKDCRKEMPKQMNVTIPDECLPTAKSEGMTDSIRQVYGMQTLKKIQRKKK